MADPGAVPQEKLGQRARVTSSILRAYLDWTKARWGDATARLEGRLDPDALALVKGPLGENRRIPFRHLIAVSRAIAAVEGGDGHAVFVELGRHSARVNLKGAYDSFSAEAPHHFFGQMDHLHRTFQSFGRSEYTRLGERSGRIRLEGYPEYSPVYCRSGLGYYEQALAMMKAPGPLRVEETACQCLGQPACVFDLGW